MNVNIVAPWQGRLKWVGKPAEGTSNTTGNPWKRVDFVVSFINSQMQEENICFSMSGVEKVNRLLGTPLGTEIIVTWKPSANEYQGKWYPKLDAIGFRPAQQLAPHQVPPQQQYPQQAAPYQGGFQQAGGQYQQPAYHPSYQPQQGGFVQNSPEDLPAGF